MPTLLTLESAGRCAQTPHTAAGGLCLLNEDQTYFLMALARNTEQAVELKKRLVQAFADCRRRLRDGETPSPSLRLAAFDALKIAKEGARVCSAPPGLARKTAQVGTQ